jgi:SNF-related kinase
MLQREPEVRASLEDIVLDSWLTEDDDELNVPGASKVGGILEEEMIPLVSREHLTDEEHSSVLQKMVNGAIAHREDIIA